MTMAQPEQRLRQLNSAQVLRLHLAGAHVIDSRPEVRYRECHLRGARQPNGPGWEATLQELLRSVMPVILVASRGAEQLVARQLRAAGIENLIGYLDPDLLRATPCGDDTHPLASICAG